MNTRLRAAALAALLLSLGASPAPPGATREEACRANNLGAALLEQVKFSEAAEAFRRALKLEPALDIAQVNLAIALFNVPDLNAAAEAASGAVARRPDQPQAHYVAGLVAKAQNRPDDAAAALRRVLAMDEDDVGANVNLAQVLMQQQKFADAIPLLRRAVQGELHNSTAVYALATALLRSGDREEGAEQMKRFQALRESGHAASLGQNYPQQGRYAEAIVSTGTEALLVDSRAPAAVFRDATAAFVPKASNAGWSHVTLFDFDGDGDLDVFAGGQAGARLLRNDGGVLSDVTRGSGVSSSGSGGLAVAGDYDNDGRPDLLARVGGRLRLYHNEGHGRFADVSDAAGVPAALADARAAAFIDVDHDGDLDLFAAGITTAAGKTAPNVLLRNNGEGRFTDVAAAAGIAEPTGVAAVVPTDYDERRDVDLLLAGAAGGLRLMHNRRDGTFRDAADEARLAVPASVSCVAAGDVNKDGRTDFFFGRADGRGTLALSDGRARFTMSPAPEGASDAVAAQFLDYDNDGLLDLVLASPTGLRVLRHLGNRWEDVSAKAVAPELGAPREADAPRAIAAADIDGDGDTDLVLATAGGLRVARNEGGERSASLRVRLTGKASNRSGIGAKVEARAGSLRHRLEVYAVSPPPAPADLLFGLGTRATADAVRILWPSGTLQAETDLPRTDAGKPAVRAIEELDRTPSSCPYLFAWNGKRFSFVTDFMGGGEMGAWLAPGARNRPDPEEYVRIGPEQLRERDGLYELRVTHELEEVLYIDRLELLAVAHPARVQVYPNEGLTDPPRPFALHAVQDVRPPLGARNERGNDVLARVRHLDGLAADGFDRLPIRGYAAPHALTLDLDDAAETLLLTGWTEYAFSSDNVAAHQAGLSLAPPSLAVKDGDGRWRTVVPDIGFPVGRPQTIAVDLSKLPARDRREVRIGTNMRVFWDQVRVGGRLDLGQDPVQVPLLAAGLSERGFSEVARLSGSTALGFDYDRVTPVFPWKLMPGSYTRPGNVVELLGARDDRFVVCHPGDQIALAFDAGRLPPLPPGWTWTYLLHVHGFSKEMDLHSASPDDVGPLPFHGMTGYPPTGTPAGREGYLSYVETYNTRAVTRSMPLLETVVSGGAQR